MSDEPKKENKPSTPAKKGTADKNKNVAKQPPEKTNDTKSAKSGSGIGWLALLLVLGLAAGGYYFYNQLQLQISALSSGVTASQASSSNEQQQKLNVVKSEISNISNKIEHVEETSSNGISLLQRQVGKSKNQWLIAEAEYLVSIANTRVQLAGDLKTAVTAFQAADQRLKENGDPSTFAVRAQIAKEIITLQSTELPDIVGLSSQILALEGAVNQMSISEPHAGSAQAPEIGKGDPSVLPNDIKETLNDAWANFSKLVVVRRNDQPKAALMTPEQVELIRKNLALKLEAARLALIHGDQALYASSLTIVSQWLNDYFDAENPSVKTAVSQIQSLTTTTIKATFPDVSKSLSMLRKLPLLAIDETATENTVSQNIIPLDKPAENAQGASENTTSPDTSKEQPSPEEQL